MHTGCGDCIWVFKYEQWLLARFCCLVREGKKYKYEWQQNQSNQEHPKQQLKAYGGKERESPEGNRDEQEDVHTAQTE